MTLQDYSFSDLFALRNYLRARETHLSMAGNTQGEAEAAAIGKEAEAEMQRRVKQIEPE